MSTQCHTFIRWHLPKFVNQARANPTNVQFAFMLLIRHGQPLDDTFKLIRLQDNSLSIVENQTTDHSQLTYPEPKEAINFMVARPDRKKHIHSEFLLLDALPKMMENFKRVNNDQSPDMIILFSWFIPCNLRTPNCREKIRNVFSKGSDYAKLNIKRVVAYGHKDEERQSDADEFHELMKGENISVCCLNYPKYNSLIDESVPSNISPTA